MRVCVCVCVRMDAERRKEEEVMVRDRLKIFLCDIGIYVQKNTITSPTNLSSPHD